MKISGFQLGIIRKCRKKDLDPKRPGHKICLYTKDGKRPLGRHRTRASALSQERAIQMRRHGVPFKRRGKRKGRK